MLKKKGMSALALEPKSILYKVRYAIVPLPITDKIENFPPIVEIAYKIRIC
jgi:hypothetical protein